MSLDSGQTIIRSRGYLPHWEQSRSTYFVTFRLADSLPEELVRQWQHQRRQLAAASRAGTATSADINFFRALLKKVERQLDAGRGTAFLLDHRVAKVVFASLLYFHGQRYKLHAACVMPNHVHVVFSPFAGNSLAPILHSWKSNSAHKANLLLGRKGHFWQREYFDHLIRDGKSYSRIIRYVLENPIKAGLRNWPWLWPSPVQTAFSATHPRLPKSIRL